MSIQDIFPLFLIMLTLSLVPGASVALVVARSISHGVSSGIAVSVGIVFGDILFIILAIFGLSIIADTMGWLFSAIKYAGAAYLLWIGFTLLGSRSTATLSIDNTVRKANLASSFFAGLFLTLGDIKAIFFYVSLFPAFVNLAALQLFDVLIILLVTLLTVGGVKIFYAVSASQVASMLRHYNLDGIFKKTAAVLILGTGSYIMIKP